MPENPPAPALSIVLPVFNGGRFLAAALDSLLAQTYADFELLASDNGSTDDTPAILARYAARDPRLRLHRFARNLGAARNFNHLFPAARGRYFKWAAHDDLCAPRYLEACIGVLESDPSVALCHSLSGRIYADGRRGAPYAEDGGFDDPDPVQRFRRLVTVPHRCIVVFGVFRREALAGTALLAPYVGSDRNLLAEVGLRGRLACVPETLFLRRSHGATSLAQYPDEQARIAWFDPALAGRPSYPLHRNVREYLASVARAPLAPDQKAACEAIVKDWVRRGRHYSGAPVRELYARERERLKARA